MKIAVCVKRVPDTTTQVKVGPTGKSIDITGVQWIANRFDEHALEEALRIKEKTGAGEVIVISLGPADAAGVIRRGLAMGADRGILLKDEAPERDGYGIAVVLAETLKELAPDLILFGKQAMDDDAHQVPGLVAEILGLPLAAAVVKLERDGNRLKAEREIEGGHEIMELAMPAVISAEKGLNEPRDPSLKGIMAAKKKPLEERVARAVEPTLTVLRMEPPPPRPAPRVVGKGVEAVPELLRLLREEAKVL